MATGIIIVDKAQNWTSQDVAARLRRVFHTKRVGHGGTLDPMATGVLPVFVGRATRAVEFFEHAEKEYEATVRFGILTDTQDTTGTVLETRPGAVSREMLEAVLPQFLGKQTQLPPMYSAVKVGGKKLYELARQGKTVERTAREIEIYDLELLEVQRETCTLRVTCSKGTYIRTLCQDLGLALGCGGAMAALRRIRAGAYTLRDAVPLEELLTAADRGEPVEELLRPVDSLFLDRPPVRLSPEQERHCRNGAAFYASLPPGEYRLYAQGEFLALGKSDGKKMWTVKSFFEVS